MHFQLRLWQKLTVIACVLALNACSSLNEQDRALLTQYQLTLISQSTVDAFYSNDHGNLSSCQRVELKPVELNLGSVYDTVAEKVWKRKERDEFERKLGDYFAATLKDGLIANNINLVNSAEQACLTIAVEVYDVLLGRQGRSNSLYGGNQNAGFEQPIYLAKVRVIVSDTKTNRVSQLLLDTIRPLYPVSPTNKFVVEPEQTQAILKQWANTLVSVLRMSNINN